MIESFTIIEPNSESVETCSRYEIAPAELLHDNDNSIGLSMASCAGRTGIGGAGAAIIVVNDLITE